MMSRSAQPLRWYWLVVRRFLCENPPCSAVAFDEQIPGLAGLSGSCSWFAAGPLAEPSHYAVK
jgi:hypothetical protein